MTRSTNPIERVRPIMGAIKTVPIPPKFDEDQVPPSPPFITISREPGAGAWTLAQQLVESLNRTTAAEQSWTCWDRELVEKVAADMKLSARLIDSLEDRRHSWLGDFLESLSFSDSAQQFDEAKVYSRMCATIRALAEAGRVVVVGCGGVFVTRKMRGGIHVRLVAPFEHRVAFMSREHHLTPDRAAARIKQLERNRQAFYRCYWPHDVLSTETFHITINTACVEPATMIDMITSLVRQVVAAKR